MELSGLKKRLISIYTGFLLIFAGFSCVMIFTNTLEIVDVEATGSIIIVDGKGNGNYTSIQAAIDNASSGDIIHVWDGIYYENIIINKSITLIGNSPGNTTIDGNEKGHVIFITSDWVNISGLTVKNSSQSMPVFYAGIKLDNVENITIENNNCSDNFGGILLNNSNSVNIKNNICNNNSWHGINGIHSNRNKFIKNTCEFNSANGINLFKSSSNELINNKCNSNNQSGIALQQTKSISVINNTCLNNKHGIEVGYCDSNNIENNFCSFNKQNGILLWDSNLNKIENNIAMFNNERGISIFSSNSNALSNNSFLNNSGGILLTFSDLNEIINNTSNFNDISGLAYHDSNQNLAKQNNFSYNLVGIHLDISDNNDFIENNMSNNVKHGFEIKSTSNSNEIFYNNIISNSPQALDEGNNNWHYNKEGNYWSDYQGLDNGAGGRVADDGIGDTNIPHLGLDYYPFINSSGWLNANYTKENPIYNNNSEDNGSLNETGDDPTSSEDENLRWSNFRITIIIFIIILVIFILVTNRKKKPTKDNGKPQQLTDQIPSNHSEKSIK